MTVRTALGACCAILTLVGPAQAVTCATEAQRKLEVEKLYERIDWFLSIVEEVPEGIAAQFRRLDLKDERATRQAFAHPLWAAHTIREGGATIKRALGPQRPDTPESRLKGAIIALRASASFAVNLSDYANRNPGRRIIDLSDWSFRYFAMPYQISMYADCLVDALVSSGRGSGLPTPQ
ncbi:MAG: hypothetical protein WB500_11725 [Rhodoplanes sp.]